MNHLNLWAKNMLIHLKKKYSYAAFTKSEWNDIEENVVKLQCNQINQIEKLIQDKMKEKIEYEGNRVLKNYIEICIFIHDDLDSNLKELKKIIDLCNLLSVKLDEEIIRSMIQESKKLGTLLKAIINESEQALEEFNINKFLEVYSSLEIDTTEQSLNDLMILLNQSSKKSDVNDCISTYLSSIWLPLLTSDQEKVLAQKIAQGDQGARETFILHNLRLVVSIAKNYVGNGVAFLDLIQEGNIGLMKAVDQFDVERNIRFSTYATYSIMQAIERTLQNQGNNVRIPVHRQEDLNKLKRAKAELSSKLNREVTEQELAEKTGIPLKRVKSLISYRCSEISLNIEITDDSDTLEVIIEDKRQVKPNEYAFHEILKEDISKMLKERLTEKELLVITLRYGLNGEEKKTLKEVGELLNFTCERIRQIEKEALKKMYSYARKHQLESYIDLEVQTVSKKIYDNKLLIQLRRAYKESSKNMSETNQMILYELCGLNDGKIKSVREVADKFNMDSKQVTQIKKQFLKQNPDFRYAFQMENRNKPKKLQK